MAKQLRYNGSKHMESGFSDVEYRPRKRRTKREDFLRIMDEFIN